MLKTQPSTTRAKVNEPIVDARKKTIKMGFEEHEFLHWVVKKKKNFLCYKWPGLVTGDFVTCYAGSEIWPNIRDMYISR